MTETIKAKLHPYTIKVSSSIFKYFLILLKSSTFLSIDSIAKYCNHYIYINLIFYYIYYIKQNKTYLSVL